MFKVGHSPPPPITGGRGVDWCYSRSDWLGLDPGGQGHRGRPFWSKQVGGGGPRPPPPSRGGGGGSRTNPHTRHSLAFRGSILLTSWWGFKKILPGFAPSIISIMGGIGSQKGSQVICIAFLVRYFVFYRMLISKFIFFHLHLPYIFFSFAFRKHPDSRTWEAAIFSLRYICVSFIS